MLSLFSLMSSSMTFASNNPFASSISGSSERSGPEISSSSSQRNSGAVDRTNESSTRQPSASGSQSGSSSILSQLPPEPEIPDEAPPPYSPPTIEAESQIFVPQFSNTQGHVDVPSGSPSNGNSSLAPPALPTRPHSQGSQSPPLPRRYPNDSRPPQMPSRPQNGPPANNNQSQAYGRPSSWNGSNYPQGPPSSQPQPGPSRYVPPPGPPVNPPGPPFAYPPGYWCRKCHNTSIKLKNGLPCQDCYSRFARQRPGVNVVGQRPGYGIPTATLAVPYLGPPSHTPIIARPGDPRIGGILCGNCRGKGYIYDFFGDFTCPTCKGIGRLL